MRKLKVNELKEQNEKYLNLGVQITDFDNGYISDIISEIATNNVDIYTSDLLDWAKDGINYIEEAIAEFGTSNDFLGMIRQGQYLAFEQELNTDIETMLLYFMYDYIEKMGIEEITEEQQDKLENDFDFEDINEKLENLIEYIKDVFESEV